MRFTPETLNRGQCNLD